MVFFGATLPAKNMAIRMNNLNIALKNDQIKLLSAVNIISQNVNNPPEIIQAKVSLITDAIEGYNKNKSSNEKINLVVDRPVEVPRMSRPLTSARRVGGINLDELKKKLNDPTLGLKKTYNETPRIPQPLSNAYFEDTASDLPFTESIPSPTSVSRTRTTPNITPSETDATMSSETDFTINNIVNSLVKEFENPNYLLDDFNKSLIKINKMNLKTKIGNKSVPFLYWGEKTGKKIDKGKVFNRDNFEAEGQKTFDFIKSNPELYIQGITQLAGAGLFKTSNSLASKRAPNFGNLWINEKSLKKNVLSIMRPYSNIYEITAKSISSLLKKMIIDIANTLEFDIKDYENLETSEKKIIERIINKQKQMKNYNIKTLIGDDINKSRKRLEILFGQINSGNDSSLVFAEALDLLKSLFENGAISHTKYALLKRNLRAHMDE